MEKEEDFLYVYKVVYPGGTFIRSSPSIDAEKVASMTVNEYFEFQNCSHLSIILSFARCWSAALFSLPTKAFSWMELIT